MASVTGPEIERLIQLLAKLPGLGPRSARRAALHLVKKREQILGPLADAMQVARERILVCDSCGNIDTLSPCTLCSDPKRDNTLLIVVEDVADLWALERAGATAGRYHVLGGVLAALDGIGPKDIHLEKLVTRATDGVVNEIVLATNFTNEGEATAHYISETLKARGLKVSRLARGVPVGGELEYVDAGTIARAMLDRRAT